MDFAVPADHIIKLKESEKKDKYLYLIRELKKLWNIKVTFIPIIIDALGTVTESLLKGRENLEIRGLVETTQTTALLRSARILRRLEETCCPSNSSEGVNNNDNNNKVLINKEINRTCRLEDFVFPADCKVNIKESETIKQIPEN